MSVDSQHHDPNAIPEQEAHPYHLPPPPVVPPDPLAEQQSIQTKDDLIERQVEHQPLPQNESYQPIDDPLAPPPPHLEPMQQQQPPHLIHHHHHPQQLVGVPPDHAPPPPPPPAVHGDPVHGAVPTHHQNQQQQLVSVPPETAPPPHSVHGAPSSHAPEPQPQVHSQPPDPLEQHQQHQNQQQPEPQQHHQHHHEQHHHHHHHHHQELVAIPPEHPPPPMHATPPVHGAPTHAAQPPAPPQVQTQPPDHAQQHVVVQHSNVAYQTAPPPSNHPLPAPPPVHLTAGMLPVPPPLPGQPPHQTQQPANTLHHTHSEPQAAELPQPHQHTGPPPSKKQRRRYDNNFKAEVLDHLKMPGTKLPAVAKQYGIPENTLREWTKVSVVQSIEAARAKHGGTLKANMFDPMNKLTVRLMEFFERNEMEPHNLKQPVTTKLVVRKGLEARDAILAEDQRNPTLLDAKERKALEAFTGSDSWAKKFAKRHDLKMTGARVKELLEEDVRNFTSQLRTMACRVKQAGPGYDEVTSLLRQAADKLVSARIVVARGSRHPSAAAAKQAVVEHPPPHHHHHHQQQQQPTHHQQTHHQPIIGEI